MKPWYRRQLVLFISGSILIAFLLVSVSMALYASSGAALLDLSRPGYKQIQDKVEETDTFESFPASGAVNGKTIDQFQRVYDRQARFIEGDAFNPAVLDEQALGIDAPAAEQ